MFYIYANGKSIYEPMDDELTIHSPKLTLEMGKAGSLQFMVPPSHRYYSQFNQLRTVITVELDGVEIFRGRVLSNNRNFNNMRTIYCEGDLAYLVDSVQKANKFDGTTHDLFRQIIARHNARVDSSKRFTVGTIGIENRSIVLSGKTDDESTESLETTDFDYKQIVLNSIVDDWETSFDYIETCLIDYCGGYLRTRRINNTTYIDLVTDYGNTAIQEIEFGKNLLDLMEEVSAEDVFTVLIPLGDENLTIAEVNNGSDELVDTAGVELYGRIVRTKVFDNVTQASTLLENAQRYMASHINLPITITVKAVDMHLVDKSVKEIYIGDRVHVNSLPHNIVDYLTCTKIEYDLDNPANDTYTFGNPRQTMTERYRKDIKKSSQDSTSKSGAGGGASGGASEEETKELLDKFYDAWINVDEEAAHIDLGTLYKELKDGKATLESSCGISLDAPSGNINIKALRKEFDDLDHTVAEQSAYIDLLNDEQTSRIALVASRHQKLADLESTHYAEMLIHVDDLQAKIDLNAEHITATDGRVTESNTRISMLNDDLNAQITLEAAHKKELDGKITSSNAAINQVANDLNAQITLEAAHKKELDGKIASSNASIQQLSTDLIAQITLEAAHKKELDGKITTSNANIKQVADDLKAQVKLEANHKKDLDTSIASLWITANNLGSEITLKADKTTVNSKVTEINGKLTAINADIATLNAEMAEVDSLIAKRIDAALVASKNIIVGGIACGAILALSIAVTNSMTCGGKQVATQTWVENKGYATEDFVTGKGYLTEVPDSIRISTLSATSNMFYKGWTVATEKWVKDYVSSQLTSYAKSEHSHSWSSITDKPSTFAPSAHRHSFSASTTAANGHTHSVTINGTSYTTGGVSTNVTHTISISGTTNSN